MISVVTAAALEARLALARAGGAELLSAAAAATGEQRRAWRRLLKWQRELEIRDRSLRRREAALRLERLRRREDVSRHSGAPHSESNPIRTLVQTAHAAKRSDLTTIIALISLFHLLSYSCPPVTLASTP